MSEELIERIRRSPFVKIPTPTKQVYVVRLTEEAHNWLIGLAADVDTSWMSPGNQDIAREASSALQSARPERPERQALLEELAALALLVSYTANDPNDEGQRRFREAAKRFRFLEGK